MPPLSPIKQDTAFQMASLINNPYFTVENDQLQNVLGIGAFGSLYPKLVPKGGKAVVDVFGDMCWSNRGDLDEVPYVNLKEFQLDYGTWTVNLAQIYDQLKNVTTTLSIDSFLKLYAGSPTNFSYRFPYLLSNGDSIKNIENSWVKASGIGDALTSMAGKGTSTLGAFGDIVAAGVGAGVGALTPGFGFEETYQFGSTSTQSVTISFPLYNTKTTADAFKHFAFVNLFAFQNLKTRTSLMTFIPPKIYTIDTNFLGGIYMAAAYVQSFKVDSIGTTRRMSGMGSSSEILIPEAYKVSITFTDLVSQSSNIFAGTIGGPKVNVVEGLSSEIKAGIDSTGSYISDKVRYAQAYQNAQQIRQEVNNETGGSAAIEAGTG